VATVVTRGPSPQPSPQRGEGANPAASQATLLTLLRHVSWPELRHHAWRHGTAWLAIVLGVALAFSVHLINESALGEFSAAVRQVNGQPDFELRAQRDGFDEALYARVALHPRVAIASPVIEVDTFAIDANGTRVPLRVVGLDALVAAPLSPLLMPRPDASADRLALLDPGSVFINAAARRSLGEGDVLNVQTAERRVAWKIEGSVSADGPPLAVMDIAGAQASFGWLGRLSRIDVRLVPGADREAVLRELALPSGVRAASPNEAAQRISNLSRAYRVNLSVLALVALFTGAFLVFSILSLSVAKRLPQLALLSVLGLTARERLALVLAESAVLGVAGSVAGLALGTGLAALALRLLAGDMGGGYFPGVTPTLHFSPFAAAVYGTLGVIAALAGGWLPAREAQGIAPALALKGLGDIGVRSGHVAWGPALLIVGGLLALAPPIAGMPLAAYAAVALLLLGGIVCVPAGVGALLRMIPPPRNALALLAVERARHQRSSATIAVAGVVASLALSVALTVMVASFRESVTHWLDSVLPADLYARSAAGGAAGDVVFIAPAVVDAVRALPDVARLDTARVAQVQLDDTHPAVALIARSLADPAQSLPLIGDLLAPQTGVVSAYVSEPMANVYGIQTGQRFRLPLPNGRHEDVFVRGVWRDYARQHGALVLDSKDFQRLTGDVRVNDLAMWLAPGADAGVLQQRIRALSAEAALLEFATPGQIRTLSLRIFDRSFAVTYWLQAVAVGIGLFGIAASFSAQVLARRREFGLLAHLGLTRRQILSVVAAEGAVWTAAGVLVGLALGLAVSIVLVEVVNPQSFHWTMDLLLPWGRLGLLSAVVLLAGTLTAWLAGRAAAGRDAALAVKQDW
jgi:putative ABC transport system permease protein